MAELVHEPKERIELRVARQALLQTRHPDENQSGLPFIEDCADLFKARHSKFRLPSRLLTQMERIIEVDSLREVTKAVVEAARESLVIGLA